MKPKGTRARLNWPKSPKTTQTKPELFLIDLSLGALLVCLDASPLEETRGRLVQIECSFFELTKVTATKTLSNFQPLSQQTR
jgi:hypothetical protein